MAFGFIPGLSPPPLAALGGTTGAPTPTAGTPELDAIMATIRKRIEQQEGRVFDPTNPPTAEQIEGGVDKRATDQERKELFEFLDNFLQGAAQQLLDDPRQAPQQPQFRGGGGGGAIQTPQPGGGLAGLQGLGLIAGGAAPGLQPRGI